MLEKLRPWFKRLIAPIARALTRMGITANAVTVIGAVGTTIGRHRIRNHRMDVLGSFGTHHSGGVRFA